MRRKWYLGFALVLLCVFLVLVMLHDVIWFLAILIPLALLWIYDVTQKKHAILYNFPILGHIRYIFEFIRPEIQQYFIADDESERPFNRETRSVVYQRAKNVRDTVAFGTEKDILAEGYEWVLHSLLPQAASEIDPRITIGGPQCQKPYQASRLNISAMSFGALSKQAVLALNHGAKAGGFAHNTGEGGLTTYHLAAGADVIWQIGTGYFGCRNREGRFDLEEFRKEANRDVVKMIEIKLSQGAKPSHGGILPKVKLTAEIAGYRKVPMGQDVFSPPHHSAFSTPIELLEFLQSLRKASGGKPIGFKLCIGHKHEFLSICKAMLASNILPDFITVDGAEGGTGAAPMEYADHVGMPLRAALSFVHSALVGTGLREHIRIICSGKVATGFDMVAKIAMGADACNSARAMMMALGCVQSKQCNANTCPTGVATQDKRLMKGLHVKNRQARVANYHKNTVKSFLEIVAAMGLKSPDDLRPQHLLRRLSINNVKSYAEIYDYLPTGALLGDDIPASFATVWAKASAERF